MRNPRWWLLGLLIAIFLFNQVLERICNIHIPLLYSYLDDLLAVPVTLGLYHLLLAWKTKNPEHILSPSIIILCIAGFIFHFEILMPMLSTKYTRDIWDPVMYLAGGIFYVLVMNKNIYAVKMVH